MKYANMKKFLILLLGLVSISAQAKDDGLGLGIGIIAGTPTGLSLKKWTSDNRAIDAAAEWSTSGKNKFYFHANYLIHNFDVLRPEDITGKLPVYYGIGGYIELNEDTSGNSNDDDILAVRIPLGVSYLFSDAPIELFAEVVPTMEISPDTDLGMDAAVGGRFYF